MSLGIIRMQPWLACVPMLLYSLGGMPCRKIPEGSMPIFLSPIGFPGPPGITSGMLADHVECGLYQGAFASFLTTEKSPVGVGHAGIPGAHG